MAEAVECWLGEGIEVAMRRFNKKGERRTETSEE
jgi:hypothetical protein